MSLRVAIFAHSVNPRGGVAHALSLGEALLGQGIESTVIAPDPKGAGFFRTAACETIALPAAAGDGDLRWLVQQRIGEIGAFMAAVPTDRWHIVHAQDPISANALIAVGERVPALARTVHHVDSFDDPALARWNRLAIERPAELFCVSPHWQRILQEQHGRRAHMVGNGVATARFRPEATPDDAKLRYELGLGAGPIFLHVGGIERRKNSLGVLEAFHWVQAALPEAVCVFAGGATLLDHSRYRAEFVTRLSQFPADGQARVKVTGPLPQAALESLYRLADALVFPSIEEGFGLAVIEAMASGLPVIVADRPPFRDYLRSQDCLWADPFDPAAIAAAMRACLDPRIGPPLAARGPGIAARFTWQDVAARHLPIYARLAAPVPVARRQEAVTCRK